ncbi:MAG TPA: hypothetical protein VKV36_01225 [Acidimicrobiales bacterium]|nr:hypothetical protein [Acidimicrobiales bacterium]
MEIAVKKALGVGTLIGLAGLVVCACGPSTITGTPVASSPAGSTTSAPAAASTTSTTTVPTATCQSSQLEASLEGVQGAAGNVAAAFWIADMSGTPCALEPSITVDVLDGSGTIRMSASKVLPAPIPLGADGVIPSGSVVAQPGQSLGLAFVSLFWPTPPNVVGSTDGQMPPAYLRPHEHSDLVWRGCSGRRRSPAIRGPDDLDLPVGHLDRSRRTALNLRVPRPSIESRA